MSEAAAYVYAGNRSTVLRRMLDLGLPVKHILPASGTWLESEAPSFGLPVTTIGSKSQAFETLQHLRFDVFVSTGFPYILPISKLRQKHPNATFINIHPSFLPDLRGADPIPGAILFRRDSGVTCHLMDDGIDTGPIVCQQLIRHFDGLDSKLLYHLCFRLEPQIFEEALKTGFAPAFKSSPPASDTMYYSFKSMDSQFNAKDDDNELLSRLRAFNTPRRGFKFKVEGVPYLAFEGAIVSEITVLRLFNYAHRNEIVSVFEDSLLVMRDHTLIRLSNVEPRPTTRLVGCRLG